MTLSTTMPSHIQTSLANSPDNKAITVQSLFNGIASTYDLLNDCISLGMHRGWKQAACDAIQLQSGDQVLDVCTGTGDLCHQLATLVGPSGQVVGLDFAESMLDVGRQRFKDNSTIQFQQGDAMSLPFEDNMFDGAVISFGLRNVADIQQTLNEMARVVRPGGWVVNLDTNPNTTLPGYWWYFSTVMPLMGRLLSKDHAAYDYLCKSTQGFDAPEILVEKFKQAGLTQVSDKRLGFGSVAMISGQA